ncbi:hydroxymethylglutaryl-CoA reductase, degradative [Acidisoma cellulosilytica]|uniref:3-hydroxy-3-methylglutaryl coenzyme A reductase n=1 Tax=Acidisoma cellulosilyticum TaxID=2802395 RepID=A0A963Z1H7_9PROT|nr:hydroxymethylglutaryl-CoA reductase, degradative [Acidisoma cellulosilyticum]MCB8881098.1 hydroxymethylglutaryl-CoA reductase, degradative [Acidisoma cellulosilyticum]
MQPETIKTQQPDLTGAAPAARLHQVAAFAGLSADQTAHLAQPSNIERSIADHMIENMVTTLAIPVGVATGLLVDGQEVMVPLAIEETSIVSFVTDSARKCRPAGGITTSMSGTVMIAQIQLVHVPDPYRTRTLILERRDEIGALCDACDPTLLRMGGGFRDIEVRIIDTAAGPMVVLHLLIDTRDAMGANTVNTMAEAVAPRLKEWTGAQPLLRILSNLADRRLARAHATWRPADIGGEAVRDAIVLAYRFADADPYRATTNNKGIMNGISAVVLATGNDTRAVEAGAHAYAARSGRYRSLSQWEVDAEGNLCGSIELPMAVGLVGGATRTHPTARVLLAITGAKTAEGLARIIAAVGLVQNFGALHALTTDGIQKGHMARHASNVAIDAGAVGEDVAQVAQEMIARRSINVETAKAILAERQSQRAD